MFKALVDVGLSENLSSFDKRRVRLVNALALIAALLILIFGLANLFLGSLQQAFLILSGLLISTFPTLYLNWIKKYKPARHTFAITIITLIAVASFNSIITDEFRYNEIFLVGFAAFIVIVFEDAFRMLYFILCTLLVIAMITTRRLAFELPIDTNTILSYINAITSLACVYFFTSLYKQDMIKSNRQLEQTSAALKTQRDEVYTGRQLLRSAIDSLPVFIALLDMEGIYLIANSKYEEAFEKPLSEIEGKDFKDVLSIKILKTHNQFVERGLNGEELEFEESTEFPNGEKAEVLGKYIPVYDANHKQFALAVYVVDITTQKQIEAKLMALNKSKNRLLSLISHDLRSPLNSLKGLIDLADGISENEIKGFIDKINTKLTSVNFSLDNLLNWAKAQMDGFNFQPELVRITDLVQQELAVFEEKFGEKKIEVSFSKTNKALAWADIQSISLVLRNIISNAIKFSPEASSINIALSESKNAITLAISNQGKSISPKKVEELFQGVQSVESTTGTRGEQGTGLGLSLSIEIMKKNKGALNIRALENNSGTVVELLMPKAK